MTLIFILFFTAISLGQKETEKLSDTKITLKEIEAKKLLLANKNFKYKATIWNTNFIIPAVRFNFSESTSESKGDVSFFNSIGAGIGRSRGEIREIRDEKGDIIDQDFTNTFAWYFGFLFAADTGDEKANIFAPMVSFVVLDFQLGIGHELGSVQEGKKRTFITLGYNIPIYKLKRGGYYISKNSGLIDDSNFGSGLLGK